MNQMTPQYSTMLFSEIWSEASDFVSDYKASGLYVNESKISDTSATTIYYLLYAQYGNNPITNRDVNQFAYKVYAIIFKYGPAWEKKLDVQKKVRELTDAEIVRGTKQIYNHSFNPSSAPGTSSIDELQTVNDQTTNNVVRGKLEGYGTLLSLIESDVTEEFIAKFKPLFKQFVMPERPLIYESEGEEN